MHLGRAAYQPIDEADVLGLQADKNNNLNLLRPEKTSTQCSDLSLPYSM